jgi:hypothetical protein
VRGGTRLRGCDPFGAKKRVRIDWRLTGEGVTASNVVAVLLNGRAGSPVGLVCR